MGARLIWHLAPSNCRCRSSFRHWIFRRSLQECYTGGVPLWSKVSKVPKVPKVPSLFPFIPRLFHLGTFDTGLILLLVLNLIMWSREPTSEPLLQAMGRGWEWTGEIGKKRYANFGRRSTRPLFSYAFPQCQKCQKFQKFHRFLSGVPKVPSFEFWHFGTFGSGTPPGATCTLVW